MSQYLFACMQAVRKLNSDQLTVAAASAGVESDVDNNDEAHHSQ